MIRDCNEWTVSGEVFYLKELDNNEFSASVKVRGKSRRFESDSSQIMEFGCLMDEEIYQIALEMGLDKFKYVTLGGHFETWVKQTSSGDKPRIRFVCDEVLEVN